VLGAAAAGAISFLFAGILASLLLRAKFQDIFSAPRETGPSFRQMVLYSFPTALTGIFYTLVIWVDRLFIGYFLPASDVGVYQAISQTSIFFAIILSAFNAVFLPMISDMFHQKQFGRLEKTYQVSTKWGLYLSIPVFLTICFVPVEMMQVIFGGEYALNVQPLLILSVAQLINVGTGAVGVLLIMTGRQNLWISISGTTLGLNLLPAEQRDIQVLLGAPLGPGDVSKTRGHQHQR